MPAPTETLPPHEPRLTEPLLATPAPGAYNATKEGQIMGDKSEPITAVAKAVEESAKAGRALVEAGSSDLARFLGKALGTAAEDTVGLLGGDYLHELRLRNLDKITWKTNEKLRDRGVEEPEPIRPKALLPALEAASEESNETLQDMWASLLANAMDPGKDTSLQRIFIEALGQMEPIDALVFRKMAEKAPNEALGSEDLMERLRCRETLAAVSLDRLADLGVLREMGGPGTPHYVVTALGTELYLASSPDASD